MWHCKTTWSAVVTTLLRKFNEAAYNNESLLFNIPCIYNIHVVSMHIVGSIYIQHLILRNSAEFECLKSLRLLMLTMLESCRGCFKHLFLRHR